MEPAFGNGSARLTSWSGSGTGSGRSRIWSNSEKIAALAPMPSASDTTAMPVTNGVLKRVRKASVTCRIWGPGRNVAEGEPASAVPDGDSGLGVRDSEVPKGDRPRESCAGVPNHRAPSPEPRVPRSVRLWDCPSHIRTPRIREPPERRLQSVRRHCVSAARVVVRGVLGEELVDIARAPQPKT